MVDITLKNVSPEMLVALGDAAVRAGDLTLANGLYRNAVGLKPGSLTTQVRWGLTMRKTDRAAQLLDVIEVVEKISPATFVGEGLATWLKQPPFDRRFFELAAKHHALAPSGVTNWHWNLNTVLWAANQARALPGDFVELGVFKGHTTSFVAEYVDFAAWPKRWWLYDTFEGIPEDQVDPGWEEVNKGAYRGTFTVEEVRERFAAYGNIEVTVGRVPEIFASVCPETISFMHIDLNNATAEVGALDALYDRIVPGGVIVFDDFCWSTAEAQRRAELEWFRARGLAVFGLPTGQGLFVKPA